MANLVRITSRWDGFPGSPGYTNLYGDELWADAAGTAQEMTDRIHGLWNTVNGYLPSDVTIVISPTYEVLNEVTGVLVGEGTVATPAANVTGNNAGSYAGNAGLAVNWQTDAFTAKGRLRGRTYFVPFLGIFEDNGTLGAAVIADMVARATTLIGDGTLFKVWQRPVNGAGGGSGFITAGTVTDRAARLSSRSL